MAAVEVRVDLREFNAAFRKYKAVSKRGIATDINQKAYSIVLAAFGTTKEASKAQIRGSLRAPSRDYSPAPTAAILVNKKLGKGRGLYGSEMRKAAAELIRKRANATHFLGAGWMPAMVVFAHAIRKKVGGRAAKFYRRYGKRYGGGGVARPSLRPLAFFYYTASANKTSTDSGLKFAQEGLRRAIAQTMADMARYVARKMQQRSDRAARGRF